MARNGAGLFEEDFHSRAAKPPRGKRPSLRPSGISNSGSFLFELFFLVRYSVVGPNALLYQPVLNYFPVLFNFKIISQCLAALAIQFPLLEVPLKLRTLCAKSFTLFFILWIHNGFYLMYAIKLVILTNFRKGYFFNMV